MARAKGATPVSNFRIPAELKQKAVEKAESEGRSLTDVIVDYLREYTSGDQDG
jgi:predicted HicB family RNase H-like nuclease